MRRSTRFAMCWLVFAAMLAWPRPSGADTPCTVPDAACVRSFAASCQALCPDADRPHAKLPREAWRIIGGVVALGLGAWAVVAFQRERHRNAGKRIDAAVGSLKTLTQSSAVAQSTLDEIRRLIAILEAASK